MYIMIRGSKNNEHATRNRCQNNLMQNWVIM